MKEFIIFGDYDEPANFREDLKIFDFVVAESPAEAFQVWLRSLEEEGIPEEDISRFETDVRVMEVEGARHVFDLHAKVLAYSYKRPETVG